MLLLPLVKPATTVTSWSARCHRSGAKSTDIQYLDRPPAVSLGANKSTVNAANLHVRHLPPCRPQAKEGAAVNPASRRQQMSPLVEPTLPPPGGVGWRQLERLLLTEHKSKVQEEAQCCRGMSEVAVEGPPPGRSRGRCR